MSRDIAPEADTKYFNERRATRGRPLYNSFVMVILTERDGF